MRFDNCPGCPYREQGPAIGPRGDPSSPIVFVGEAPGSREIEDGQPFVGRAGGVLSLAVAEAGITEGHVFITNSIACQPHPVHPRVAAIDACRSRLVADIEASPRGVIVALGGTAVRAVTELRGFRVLADRGDVLTSRWGPVIPTLHPARVVRRPNERPSLVADLRLAKRLAEANAEPTA